MKKTLFNDGWSFALVKVGEHPEKCDYKPVDIPHDWLIHDTRNLYADGDGFYKKKFVLGDVKNSVYIVRFDGVYMDCEIFLNGEKIFEWKYGYTSFDVTLENAVEGENELEVIVHHKSPNTRWYSGAGIFRNVHLSASGKNRILPDGVYFCAEKRGDAWMVNIDTEVTGEDGKRAKILHTLCDADGKKACVCEAECELTDEKSGENCVCASFEMKNPHLWDVDDPYLYTLKTELTVDGDAVYEVCQRVGFKTAEFSCDKGFFLNGRPLKIHGACMHHDMGALGAAVNKNAIRRQLKKAQAMGVNSIRTSHNPPAPELMDLADEMGILIDSEAFDMWELKKTEYDYARFFPEWHQKDVKSWIRRDRNHVSVIMWSIGNEIYDTHASRRGEETACRLKSLVKLYDYRNTRPVTIGSNYMYGQGAQNCAEHMDTVGYNYAERLYDEHHKAHPEWIIYGSETGSTIQSRGVYHFPASKMTSTHDDHQCSSLMNCATGWGSPSVEYNITQDRIREFCLGQYIWTVWDYIGEPTPYWTKNSYFGQIDTAGFEKDSYYAYKAEWAGKDAQPFVHLFPYWDFNEGQLIDIFIYSNCAKTELIVNGRSMGVHVHDHTGGAELSGRWQAEYHKGYIQAVGYDENGKELCRQTRRSFGDAAKISLTPDKCELRADGSDLVFVEVCMLDSDGNIVENDRSRVNISVSGAGRLVGVDNGDSTDYGQYHESQRKLFGGRLMAIVAAKDCEGDVYVRASSEGLRDCEIKLRAVHAELESGVCHSFENTPTCPLVREVPARKIELSVSERHLTPKSRECVIKAEILPANSTYTLDDVGFKAVTDSGVETPAAKIVRNEKEGKITLVPVADGQYRLRAYCKNGTEYEEVISELEMSNEGFGKACFDPYKKQVCASLYTRAGSPLQNVFEGGVQTPSGCDSVIEFDNVEFGAAGSDEITVGLYLNSAEKIPFEIEDDSGFAESFVFDLPPWWNHYQYKTYKLKRKLTGRRNLRFVFHMRVAFQGFEFARGTNLNEPIPATKNSRVCGDSFLVCPDGIKNIGNNVTIEFDGLEFGEKGADEVIICGMTQNKNDTLHLKFSDGESVQSATVEFSGSMQPEAKRFKLPHVSGKKDLSLIFLPGCDFDLYSIEFI